MKLILNADDSKINRKFTINLDFGNYIKFFLILYPIHAGHWGIIIHHSFLSFIALSNKPIEAVISKMEEILSTHLSVN